MKKIGLAMLVAVSILFLGCSSGNVEASASQRTVLSIRRDSTYNMLIYSYIFEDSITGVNYIVVRTDDGISIIPRYNPDGTFYTS